MNNDLISRSALLESAYMSGMWNRTTQQFDLCVVDFEDVQDAPAVDAEVVRHGRWGRFGKTHYKVVCSVCKHPVPFQKSLGYHIMWKSNYCPNCGTKMEQEDN